MSTRFTRISRTEETNRSAGRPAYPSYSALLDRMDQTAAVDLRWKALPETTGVLGYSFENLDYTSPEYIIFRSADFSAPGHLAPTAATPIQVLCILGPMKASRPI